MLPKQFDGGLPETQRNGHGLRYQKQQQKHHEANEYQQGLIVHGVPEHVNEVAAQIVGHEYLEAPRNQPAKSKCHLQNHKSVQ